MTQNPAEALVELGSLDPATWASIVFPRTIRQQPPPFHKELWRLLLLPNRLCCFLCFRGSGKTSLLRIFTLWRIAYGLSRTVLWVSRSQANAERSLAWLRQAVASAPLLRTVYGITEGSKWTATEAAIHVGGFGHQVWLNAVGITGQIRGINHEDFRPDLIVLDDPLDDENTATDEQREKTRNLIHGALRQSLAPVGEAAGAKLVMLQTPLHQQDAAMEALNDPEWLTARFGCWTSETEDLPLEEQESAWPERFPTSSLRAEKASAIRANRMSIFAREMECRVVSPETAAFRREWVTTYTERPQRELFSMVVVGVDPSPPATDRQLAAGLRKKDPEVWAVWGRDNAGLYWLLELQVNRNPTPELSVETMFTLGLRWRPSAFVIEAIAYQQTLLALLRNAMHQRRLYFVVREIRDRRPKYERITQALHPLALNGVLRVPASATDWLAQFEQYPSVAHDDLLDASAMALEFMSFGTEDVVEQATGYGGYCP